MGNRQFPGAMATADWYNRLLSHREERRDKQNERATRKGEVEKKIKAGGVRMKRGETAVLVALSFYLITGSFLSSSAVQKNLDSISLDMTPGYLCDSTTLV